MKFHCPNCNAPFDSLGLPVSEVTCPNCNTKFIANPHKPSDDRSPFLMGTDIEAKPYIKEILELIKDASEGVKQCILFHLEDLLLPDHKHLCSVKIGDNFHYACSVCDKEGSSVFDIVLISRWRDTTTEIHLCEDHVKSLGYAKDFDLHNNNYLELKPNSF